MTKLEPLLQSLGAPFVGNVFKRLPLNGGVEQWESFYKTPASDEVSSLYNAPCCVYIRIPRTSPWRFVCWIDFLNITYVLDYKTS